MDLLLWYIYVTTPRGHAFSMDTSFWIWLHYKFILEAKLNIYILLVNFPNELVWLKNYIIHTRFQLPEANTLFNELNFKFDEWTRDCKWFLSKFLHNRLLCKSGKNSQRILNENVYVSDAKYMLLTVVLQ